MLTTWLSPAELNGGQSHVAEPSDLWGGVDRRAARSLWTSPVAVVCDLGWAEKISDLGPTVALQPRMGEEALRHHLPARLVVDEGFVFGSPWRRWVDDRGTAWGPLRSIAESFNLRRLPIYVISNQQAGERLDLPRAQYLPNLRTRQMQADLEFIDPLLALVQSVSEVPRGGSK